MSGPGSSAPASTALTPSLLRLLALAAGLTVANIYYNQSLLAAIAGEFDLTAAAAGNLAVATQLGYTTGLLFLVPLGDIIDRKRLIVASSATASFVLLAVAAAPAFPLLVAAGYLLGLVCVTPQFIIPYTAHLAAPATRGQSVGLVMGGLLLGILASRSAAGFVGQWLGWRAVFLGAAGLTLAISLLLLRLPGSNRVERNLSYPALLRSLPMLLYREPLLRRFALLGALAFGAFSAFWTTIVFYLAARPEHYGGNMVGLFGLVAVGGALVAPLTGRLADRYSARIVNGTALTVIVLSFLLMLTADASLILLAVGVFFMDAGVQSNQISNQTRIYALAPELRSRITSAYMVIYFLGGALGSFLGARAWQIWHWPGVCLLGVTFGLVALVALFTMPKPAPTQRGA